LREKKKGAFAGRWEKSKKTFSKCRKNEGCPTDSLGNQKKESLDLYRKRQLLNEVETPKKKLPGTGGPTLYQKNRRPSRKYSDWGTPCTKKESLLQKAGKRKHPRVGHQIKGEKGKNPKVVDTILIEIKQVREGDGREGVQKN